MLKVVYYSSALVVKLVTVISYRSERMAELSIGR
jgi:hypothetical protein